MKITPKGIQRASDSNTLSLEKAAAIICNARLHGEIFKFVGQKIKLNSADYIDSEYEHFYWHSKIGDDHIIGVNTTTKLITILPIGTIEGTTLDMSLRNFLLNFNWENDSRGFIYSGDYIGISHLNDIIILDTTEGKYFFSWDEKADNSWSGLTRGNFVWLNELPIPILNVERNAAVDNIRLGVMQNSYTYATTTQESALEDDDKFIKCRDEFAVHLDTLIRDALKNNIVNGAFYVRAAYKMYDGTCIYPSNPIFCCDYTDGYDAQTNAYNGVIHLNVLRTRYEDNGQYTYKYHTFLEALPRDYISGMMPLGTYKSYYDDLISNGLHSTSDIYVFQQQLLQSYQYKWKIQIPVDTLDIIKKWYDKGLISSIDLFITKPDKFLNLDTCHKYLNGYGMYDVDKSTEHNIYYKWFKTPIHFNKDIIETDLSKKIFYKIDSIKDFDGITVDYSQDHWAIKNTDPFIKFKNAIDIETNESLPIDTTYLTPKSGNAKVYNNMIHLLGVKNYFKKFPLSIQDKTTYNGYSDCELHYLISDGTKDHWIKVEVPKFGVTLTSITIANNILYAPNYRCKKVNITFLKNGIRYILKTITLTPHIAHNLSLEDNKEDYIIKNGFITVGITPTSVVNYSKISININGTFPEVDYDCSEYYEDINRMQLSATDNPFIYPANRSFRYGDIYNKVIGAETSSLELQDYNFGRYPMYVFTENGIFVMEVGSGDIAYVTQHLYKQIACVDNKNVIRNCKGVITFIAEDGVNIIVNGRLINVTKQLEGNNNLKASLNVLDATRLTEVNTVFKHAVSYFFNNSHVAYDNLYNEVIFINPNFTIQFVLHLDSMTFTIRTDKVETRRNYIKVLNVNNNSVFCADVYNFWEFYSTYEYDKILNVDGKGNMLITTTIIPVEQYARLKHLVARFELSPILLSNSDIIRYNVSLYVIGSRDGVDWKLIAGGTKTNVLTSLNSLEIRRAFTSVRYIQIAFFATYDDMNSVAVNQILSELYNIENDVILTNSFSEFDTEITKEHNTKLR